MTLVALLLALAGPARTAGLPSVSPPVVGSIFVPPFGESRSFEPWRGMGPHVFLLGGISIVFADLPVSGGGWTMSGGGEFPMPAGWSLVPRASLGSADGSAGTFWMGRAGLDGRLNWQRGGVLSYVEAGPAIAVQDYPVYEGVSPVNPFAPSTRQKTDVSPALQFAFGARGDPNLGKVFVLEFLDTIETGSNAVSSFEVLVGVEF
jgi:hypothetical protein